jgi:hypothetical protein
MKDLKPEAAKVRQHCLGKQVDEIPYYAGGVKAPLYWNKADTQFGVLIAGQCFQHTSAEVVKNKALELLKALTQVQWVPVILVMNIEDTTSRWVNNKELKQHGLLVHFDRFWAGYIADRQVRTAPWNTPEDQRMDKANYAYSWPKDYTIEALPFKQADDWYFPHSELLWTGLVGIAQALEELKGRLQTLLDSKDAQKTIEAAGASMLGRLLAQGGAK